LKVENVVGAIVAIVLLIVVLFAFVLTLTTFRPWFRAFLYGTPVLATDVIAMRLRGNPPTLLVDAYITLQRAGITATIKDVENAYIDNRNRILTSDDLVQLVKTQSGSRA
jgi:uncharacterized protein YqfA (UPF0365 family)